MKSLKFLDISSTEITDEGVRMLASHPSIKRIHLRNNRKITDASCEYFAKMSLQELNIEGCNSITAEGVVKLTASKTLESLNVSEINQSMVSLEGLGKMTSLKHLWLMRCEGIDNDGIEKLVKSKSIVSLFFLQWGDRDNYINQRSFELLSSMTQLEELGLHNGYCKDLTPLLRLKRLKNLWLDKFIIYSHFYQVIGQMGLKGLSLKYCKYVSSEGLETIEGLKKICLVGSLERAYGVEELIPDCLEQQNN